jgi:hypothetical protein
MRRRAILFALGFIPVAFKAGAAQPRPTPTPCPKDGYELHALFTGVLVFRGIPGGYRVILPNLSGESDKHIAYLRFRKEDYVNNSSTFPLSDEIKCIFPCPDEEQNTRYARLGTHGLIIDPAVISDVSLKSGGIGGFMAPLKDLAAENGSEFKFDSHYGAFPPEKGYAAAAIELKKGALEPLTSNGLRWRFKTLAGGKDSKIELCLADAVMFRLKLKSSAKTIRIYSARPDTGSVTLYVHKDRPTTITIGNSLESDLKCPVGVVKADKDRHFLHQYKMITPDPPDKFVPHKGKDCEETETVAAKSQALANRKEKSAAVPAPAMVTYHGHNCPPAIWPE